MQTRYNNQKENLIKITFDSVPQTGSMSKLSEALNLIDSSINSICDARISAALDTSSIQTLWSVFDEYDFVTSSALSDLDSRITTLNSSLSESNAEAAVRFSDLDSYIYDVSNAARDVRNDLIQHIIDTSGNTGTIKPEDIEQYISPVRADLYNTSVNLNGRINAAVSQIIDCELDISTLYNNNAVRRNEINNVSTLLATHIENHTQTVSTVNNHTNQITELYSTTATHTNDISKLNSSLNSLFTATAQNASVWNNQVAPNIRVLNASVNDLSTRFSTHIAECASQSAIDSLTTDIENVNASIGLIKYFDQWRDASIISLRDYQANTVDALLGSYAQRVNNAESIAVDSQYIATDTSARVSATLTDISTRLNNNYSNLSNNLTTGLNDVSANVTDALNNYYDYMSERELVTSSALVLHDSSINYILGILRTNGLIP